MLYEEVMKHDGIYSLLYSPERVYFETLENQIVFIKKEELKWAKDKNSFYFIWGWPGPDFNEYNNSTYGKGWAFTKEEIINAWE